MKACFVAEAGIETNFINVSGVLSLIFWAITWVVVIKYLVILMRANNHGEGGIMALVALLTPRRSESECRPTLDMRIILVGLFGAALLYGDGMITPAVSVLSAVEGLGVATSFFAPFVVPITIVILSALFSVQKFGTERVGLIFGPVMLLWFSAIAAVAVTMLVPNLTKILHGGWVPVVAAVVIFTLMATWARGQDFFTAKNYSRSKPLGEFIEQIRHEKPPRVKGNALFVTRYRDRAPADLLQNYQHNKIVHENVILLVLSIDHVPEVPWQEHGQITTLGDGFHEVRSNFGFMQIPNLSSIPLACEHGGMKLDPASISFYLSRDILRPRGDSKMAKWRKRFYAFTAINAQPIMEFLGVNPEWVIEIGALVDI